MKKIQSILHGSKILEIIKDILSALGSGKKPVHSVYSVNSADRISKQEIFARLSFASTIR